VGCMGGTGVWLQHDICCVALKAKAANCVQPPCALGQCLCHIIFQTGSTTIIAVTSVRKTHTHQGFASHCVEAVAASHSCHPTFTGLMAPQHCKDPDITSGSSSSSSPASRYAAELYGLRKVFKGGRTPLSCRPTFMCKPCMSPQADEGEDGLLGLVTATGSNGGSSGGSRWYSGGRRREDFWAIRGTWLGIERGQLFCLLGPNGAGKTTTINCLTGQWLWAEMGWG